MNAIKLRNPRTARTTRTIAPAAATLAAEVATLRLEVEALSAANHYLEKHLQHFATPAAFDQIKSFINDVVANHREGLPF